MTVYAIGVLEHQPSSARGEQQLRLQQIAEATGGQAFFPQSAKELDEVYEKVLAEIRAQYTLGYVSTNDADGRRVAEGRGQGRAQGRARRPRSGRGRAISRPTSAGVRD